MVGTAFFKKNYKQFTSKENLTFKGSGRVKKCINEGSC